MTARGLKFLITAAHSFRNLSDFWMLHTCPNICTTSSPPNIVPKAIMLLFSPAGCLVGIISTEVGGGGKPLTVVLKQTNKKKEIKEDAGLFVFCSCPDDACFMRANCLMMFVILGVSLNSGFMSTRGAASGAHHMSEGSASALTGTPSPSAPRGLWIKRSRNRPADAE